MSCWAQRVLTLGTKVLSPHDMSTSISPFRMMGTII